MGKGMLGGLGEVKQRESLVSGPILEMKSKILIYTRLFYYINNVQKYTIAVAISNLLRANCFLYIVIIWF